MDRGQTYDSITAAQLRACAATMRADDYKVLCWFVDNDWRVDDSAVQRCASDTQLTADDVFACMTRLAERRLLSVGGSAVRAVLGQVP